MLQVIKTRQIYYYWCQGEDRFMTRDKDVIKNHLMEYHHMSEHSVDEEIAAAMFDYREVN